LNKPDDRVPALLDRGGQTAGPSQDYLGPDRGYCLEVGLSSDEREILINLPDTGEHWIAFSPAQARNLARLLLRKADECKT